MYGPEPDTRYKNYLSSIFVPTELKVTSKRLVYVDIRDITFKMVFEPTHSQQSLNWKQKFVYAQVEPKHNKKSILMVYGCSAEFHVAFSRVQMDFGKWVLVHCRASAGTSWKCSCKNLPTNFFQYLYSHIFVCDNCIWQNHRICSCLLSVKNTQIGILWPVKERNLRMKTSFHGYKAYVLHE